MMMKRANFILYNGAIAMIVSLSSFAVLAEKSHQQKYEASLGKQMQVKCFVEFRGGGNDIRFAAGSYSKPNHAIKTLMGKNITKQNGQPNKVIYKVNECVQLKEDFSTEKARALDKVRAR